MSEVHAEEGRLVGGFRLSSGLKRLVPAGRVSVQQCRLEAEALLSICLLPGRRRDDAEERGVRPAVLGFNDWGTWWQGEIAGDYFLSNSNLKSHEIRLHTTPTEAIGTGLIFFNFNLDQPGSFAPGVTAKDVAHELDWYMDWKINENFTASFVAAYGDPGEAVQQGFDRTKNFTYGMVYVAYAY